jgi:hypothetical protein
VIACALNFEGLEMKRNLPGPLLVFKEEKGSPDRNPTSL